MYDKEFASIYNHYGWNDFSITMGNAILKFLKKEKITIKNHLDLACGVGELCHLFSLNNIKTKGVDLSNSMLEIAKKKYPHLDFEKENIITYKPKKTYNLITCTCDAVNHIIEDKELKQLFENVYNSLEEEGYFIFDIINDKKIILNKIFRSERRENVYVDYYLTKTEDNRVNNNIKIYKDNIKIKEENIVEKIYPCTFIEELANKIGFKIIQSENQIADETYRSDNKIFFILKKLVYKK